MNPSFSTPPPAALTPLLARVPLVPIQIAVGDHVWQITVVPDQTAFFEVHDDLEDPPYGFLLWEAAIGLARLLVQQSNWVRGKRVLELGAGVGLPGLVADSLGGIVWQTDHLADILALTSLNVQQNGNPPIQHFLADWRRWNHAEHYDLILGADILYDRTFHFYLEHIFNHNLALGGPPVAGGSRPTRGLRFYDQTGRAWLACGSGNNLGQSIGGRSGASRGRRKHVAPPHAHGRSHALLLYARAPRAAL